MEVWPNSRQAEKVKFAKSCLSTADAKETRIKSEYRILHMDYWNRLKYISLILCVMSDIPPKFPYLLIPELSLKMFFDILLHILEFLLPRDTKVQASC